MAELHLMFCACVLGVPIFATQAWRIKGGREARDISMRFSTGMDSTPMPSFADAFSEDERWAIAFLLEREDRF